MNAEGSSSVVSIIIPTWGNRDSLGVLFRSLEAQTVQNFEVIIVDKHSMDGTEDFSRECGFRFFDKPLGRSAARNFGASQAAGSFLLFLDSDMQLSDGVIEKCCQKITDQDALCIREEVVTQNNYWARARALERDNMYGTLYYEGARFFRKSTFVMLGGYDSDMVGFEDLDLQAKLVEKGYRIGWVDATIYHHEELVGMIQYLAKRRLYSTTASICAARHPQYWRQLLSVSGRFNLIMKSIASTDLLTAFYLLPGLLLMRGIEVIMSFSRVRPPRS